MENPAATPPTSNVIPAGHAALTTEDEVGEHRPDASTELAGLSVAALGVVFGDIGTSPVYTFRECFNPEHGLPLDPEHVLGVLSMIFWSLIIIVTLPVAAAPKDKGKTTLKDVQPAGTTEKNHKHLQYDLSFSTTTTGKDYVCRTKENEKPKATEMVVGSAISYEVGGNTKPLSATELAQIAEAASVQIECRR